MYRSEFTSKALENLKKLPKNVRNSLKKEFDRKIHRDPLGCSEPLVGLLATFRSFHFREYRVIYKVFQNIEAIAVVGVGKKGEHHFAEIYDQLEEMARGGELAASVMETYRFLASLKKKR